jgi:hypothetical protein
MVMDCFSLVCSTLENHEMTYFALAKIRGFKNRPYSANRHGVYFDVQKTCVFLIINAMHDRRSFGGTLRNL